MSRVNSLGTVAVALLALVACGGSGGSDSTPTAPYVPPVPAANISIGAASSYLQANYSTDSVSVALSNSGGSGTFYLDFWGHQISIPTGCFVQPGQTSCPPTQGQRLASSQTASVTQGYSQSVSYAVPANVTSVRVFTEPVNSEVYILTDCKTVSASGACP